MARRARNGADRVFGWVERIPGTVMLGFSVLALIGAIVAISVAIPLSSKVAAQAEAGALARDRSCALLPVTRKIYDDAERRRVIDANDVRQVFGTAEQLCSK